MKKVRIIQIGMGHDHAEGILDLILQRDDVFEVAGFAVPECEEEKFSEKIKKFRDELKIPYYTVDELLELPDIDGAVIETEEVNLIKYAQKSADKGLNIHMDKPGGLVLSEFEALINTLKEKQLVFSLGYMYRFNQNVIEALEKVKNGEIGDIYCVEAHMDCEHLPSKRQWLKDLPGGMMFFLGCHIIDLIYRIQGMPEEIIPLNTSTGYDGVTADDFGMVVFKYKNGVSFAKTCANECGGFMRRQLVICGSKGTIEIRPLEKYVTANDEKGIHVMGSSMRTVGASDDWSNMGTEKEAEPFGRYENMLLNYAEMVRGKKENPYTYEYELELYKLILRSCGKEI